MSLSQMIAPELLSTVSPRQKLTETVLKRLRAYEERAENLSAEPLRDEQVWTLLCTYGYAVEGRSGLAKLSSVLTDDQVAPETASAWLEMLPLPPRQGKAEGNESNSEIDLILGDVGMRHGISGVHYLPPQNREGWVCLVEAKYLEDIASKTTYDPSRNQMARVIETALAFQVAQAGVTVLPDRVHFTLLTPHRFTIANVAGGGPRLYSYKFREYQQNPLALHDDIEAAAVPRRAGLDWQYPDLKERLEHLSLHWVTYEQLIQSMPDVAYRDFPHRSYKQDLLEFIRRQPGCLLSNV